ncbi:KUP/HAK/KT family potassium transporter [Bdellovibrionota bacterium FG-2]
MRTFFAVPGVSTDPSSIRPSLLRSWPPFPAAYGIAVTGTMAITSLLFFTVTRKLWNWPLPLAASVVSIFLAVDLAFFSANIIKIVAGGWVPLVIAGLIFLLMTTWKWCREIVSQTLLKLAVPISDFLKTIEEKKTIRIKGTAVFMTLNRDIAPSVLLLHFQHNQVLHERVILLSILTKNEPEVDPKDRVRITDLSQGFVKVIALYGFMETPDIKEVLKLCRVAGLQIDEANLSYYLGREIFLADGNSSLPMWRKKLFIALSKNARSATEFFKLPPDQVIELGSQISI